jgi:hypothetical protein
VSLVYRSSADPDFLVVNLAAIAASAIAAILVLPAFGPWTRLADWTHR